MCQNIEMQRTWSNDGGPNDLAANAGPESFGENGENASGRFLNIKILQYLGQDQRASP